MTDEQHSNDGYNDPASATAARPIPQEVFPPQEEGQDPIAGPPASEADAPAGEQGDEIDALTGDDLDEAVEAAGIDASTGGSRADGGLTADEKRDALRAARA